MINLDEIHSAIRFLRCINMPVSSMHTDLYNKLLIECENITYRVVGKKPMLSVECDVRTNIQKIISAVEYAKFSENDTAMAMAVDVYAEDHHCVTSMEAVRCMLNTEHKKYIKYLNINQPSEIYYALFHQFDRIGRNDKGEVVSIETTSCFYQA